MGFVRQLAPHTFTPNSKTPGSDAKPRRLPRKRDVRQVLHPKHSAEYVLASPPFRKAFLGIHR